MERWKHYVFFRVVWMCNNVYTNFLQSYFTFFPFTYDGCLLPQFVLFAFPFLTTLLLLLLYFINLINSFAIHPIRLLSGAHTQFVFIDIEMGNNITMSNKMLYRQRMETERKKKLYECVHRESRKKTYTENKESKNIIMDNRFSMRCACVLIQRLYYIVYFIHNIYFFQACFFAFLFHPANAKFNSFSSSAVCIVFVAHSVKLINPP